MWKVYITYVYIICFPNIIKQSAKQEEIFQIKRHHKTSEYK